jgi:hypothetical protein
MAMFDFGRKPSWIENPPEGTMVTTAEAPTDNPFLGFEKANMQAFTKFMEDRGYQTGAIRGLQPNREVWYDNETGTAYTLSDTSNATISGGKKLPPKKPATKAAPTRPSAPIRERRASEDPLTDAIFADGDDAIDVAGLEPRIRTRQAPAPTRESEQIQSPAPTLQSEQVAPSMEERKQRLIDANVGGLLRETATGMSDDQLLERMMMDQLEIGEKARDVPRDVSRDIQQGAIDEYGSLPITSFQEAPSQPRRGRAASRDAELQRRANLPPEEETIRRGTTRSGRVIQGSKPGLFESEYTQKRGRVGRGRNEALTYGGQQTEELGLDGSLGAFPGEKDEPEYRERLGDADPIAKRTFEKQDMESSLRDLVAGMDTTQRRSTDPRIQLSTERVEEGEISPVSEGVEVGLLSRIGKAITDNPELAASGAQLLGGLISNAAQNRAQRRADRTTNQRVARANLISAITGGRARPTVERAQADTGGFMSLDTLGKVFQGGGAAVKGELSRRVEEAERERKAGLEQSAADLDKRAAELAEKRFELAETTSRNTENYKNRMAKVQEDELQLRREIFEAENNKQPVGQQLKAPQILELSSRIQAVAKADELTDFLEDADFTFLEKGRYSLDNVPQLLFGGDAAEAEARRQSLIQAIASSYGGTLSNQDIERIDKQLFTQKDEMKTSLDIAKVFRSTLVGSLERDLRLLEGGGFNVGYIRNDLYETDQGQSESDADRLGNILSDNPLDRISRQ